MVGLFSGAAAILFNFLTMGVQYLSLVRIAGFPVPRAAGEVAAIESPDTEFHVWWLLPIMAAGGLLTGWIVSRWAPEAAGPGTDGAIDAFHNRRSLISFRVVWVKMIASAITLGTGGSAGREGPIAHIGAGIGSVLAQRFKLTAHDRRIMLAIGMGAGVGAIFRAPLAGAMFAGEILYRDADIESEVIIPGALASTVAYSVFQLTLPPDLRFIPLFGESIQHDVGNLAELLPYTALALAISAAAILYVKLHSNVQTFFSSTSIPVAYRPAAGAAAAALCGIGLFYLFQQDPLALAVLGSGYGVLQQILENVGSLPIALLLVVALVKMLTTSLVAGSGGSGGIFGPSLVMGAAIGGSVGEMLHYWNPQLVPQPSSFALVGMAGFFSGSANAPFSTILMITELTGDYKLLVPTLWVSSLCFILCRPWSLYLKQVKSRLESPAHVGDYALDLLEGMRVRDVYRDKTYRTVFHEEATLEEIVHSIADSTQRYFPVFNHDEELVGIFSAEDVRGFLYDDFMWQVVNARDVMAEKVITLEPDDDLNHALNLFTALNVDELPVVDPENHNRIVGVLRRKEVIAAYNKKRLEMQQRKQEENR